MNINEDTDSILVTDTPEMVKNMHFFCGQLWEISTPLKLSFEPFMNKNK